MDQRERLAQRRRQLGLTQLEVAKAVGVSEATVSRWESGDIAEVGSGKIAALARALQMDPAELLGREAEAARTAAREAPGPASELDDYLEQLRTRPEMRAFFSLAKNATKSEVEDAMRIVEAYFMGRQAGKEQERRRHIEEDDPGDSDDSDDPDDSHDPARDDSDNPDADDSHNPGIPDPATPANE